MFRNPNGKMLRNIFNHAVLHDLTDVSPREKGLFFLLMSIAGNSSSPDGKYGFNGAMQIHFPNAAEAIDALRSRGYLVESLPLDALLQEVTAPEIKELLKSHGLPVSGKRDALVERLLPVLLPDEIAALHAKHDYWLPTDLGFEFIYSLYVLWEQRQSDLLDAMATYDLDAMAAAYQYMPNSTGFWNDEAKPAPFSGPTLKAIRSSSNLAYAFQYICGFMPEFFVTPMPEYHATAQEEECLKIRREMSSQYLERYRQSGVKKVRWMRKDKNPECAARDRKVYWIDNAPPCPVHIRCKCRYVAVVELAGENVPVDGI